MATTTLDQILPRMTVTTRSTKVALREDSKPKNSGRDKHPMVAKEDGRTKAVTFAPEPQDSSRARATATRHTLIPKSSTPTLADVVKGTMRDRALTQPTLASRATQSQRIRRDDASSEQNETEREIARLRAELDRTRTLLKVRTEELRAAEVFLTRADAVSDADVRRMVEALNAEIFQTSAHIADTCRNHSDTSHPLSADAEEFLWNQTVSSVGRTLADALQLNLDCGNSVLIQIAVQACIAKFASEVVGIWALGVDASGRLLFEVHKRITRRGEHSTPR